MNEKEKNDIKKEMLLQYAEMTHNYWLYIKARELYKAIDIRIKRKEDIKAEWLAREGYNDARQLEITHLILLLDEVNIGNLTRVNEILNTLKPEPLNNLQPIYNSQERNTDPAILQVEPNSGYYMAITKDSFLFKTPTEI